eukprot:GILK01005180.1.p2 GENE.GILK01005180.1~~GILK01005180.1.p2  ORF type:complete len:110 (-),score=11.04 GILK01005180.1:684-1013(-)
MVETPVPKSVREDPDQLLHALKIHELYESVRQQRNSSLWWRESCSTAEELFALLDRELGLTTESYSVGTSLSIPIVKEGGNFPPDGGTRHSCRSIVDGLPSRCAEWLPY